MFGLATSRIVGKHFLHILSWIYVAGVVANVVGRFWPGIRVPTFLVIAISMCATAISIMIRELRGGRESTVTVALGHLAPLIIGVAIVLLLADIIAHVAVEQVAEPIRIWGIMFWVVGYATIVRDFHHKQKLEEDLKNKPGDAGDKNI